MRYFPKPPWTRAHEKFVAAWEALDQARARAGEHPVFGPGQWIFARWGVRVVRDLTVAEAREGCRQLNAWRASIEGRVAEFREYPRQWRRNYRRHLRLHMAAPAGAEDFREFERELNRRVAATFSAPTRAVTASSTAYARGPEFENLIRGTALEGLGGVMPTESKR